MEQYTKQQLERFKIAYDVICEIEEQSDIKSGTQSSCAVVRNYIANVLAKNF